MLLAATGKPHINTVAIFFIVVQGVDRVILTFFVTRKYLLRGYILGVLTHTTAWDQNWGGDETLKLVLVYVA